MKKIKFISAIYFPYIGGGAELSNKLLVEGIKSKNKDVEVITFGEENSEEVIEKVSVKRIYLNGIISFYLKKIKKEVNDSLKEKIMRTIYKLKSYFFNSSLRNVIDKELENSKKQILHTSGIGLLSPQIWWRIAKKKNMIVVHTLRDPFLMYSRNIPGENVSTRIFDFFHKNFYIYYVSKYVDYIHSPSQYMIDLHLKNGFKFKNTKVIPNTVSIEFIKSDYKNKKIDLVYVGTLTENKGVHTLLKSYDETDKKINLTLVGEGPLREEAKKREIEVTGWIPQEQAHKKIEKSKILILPSEWEEAFGRVLIEAVACGTLVIGSDMGAIPEVLDYDERYIFKAGNPEELSKKIDRILSLSEEEYLKEVETLQEVMKKYSYEKHIDEFIKFYESI